MNPEEIYEKRDNVFTQIEQLMKDESGEIRELSDDDETKLTELRSDFDKLDAQYDKAVADKARADKIAEARSAHGVAPTAPRVEVDEKPVYGNHNRAHSWFADAYRANDPYNPLSGQARERLERYRHQMAREFANGSDMGKQHEMILRDASRSGSDMETRQLLDSERAAGSVDFQEFRTITTASGSGLSFVTPVYAMSDWLDYRRAGRAFANQVQQRELPEYGNEILVPGITSDVAVSAQGTEGTTIAIASPTTGYVTSALVTEAGEVDLSQQMLDRAGPGVQFDQIIFQELEGKYAPAVDNLVLSAALASAGSVGFTGTFAPAAANGAGGLVSRIESAKVNIETTPNVYMSATHMFMTPARFGLLASWGDSQTRPILLPQVQGPNNAWAATQGDGSPVVEGYTGYHMNGLPVFTDSNLPAPATGNDQVVVGNLQTVWLYEGTPVMKLVPQPLASNLVVKAIMYNYLFVIATRPAAVQAISGTAMSAPSFGS